MQAAAGILPEDVQRLFQDVEDYLLEGLENEDLSARAREEGEAILFDIKQLKERYHWELQTRGVPPAFSSAQDASDDSLTWNAASEGPLPLGYPENRSESHSTTQPPNIDSEDSDGDDNNRGHSTRQGTPGKPVDDNQQAAEPMEAGDRDPEHLPPDVNMADLPAGERAALTKARKKRVSALQRVGEHLAARARENLREARREERREHQEFLAELRAGREEDRQARAAMLVHMERSDNSYDALIRAVTLLVETYLARQPVPQPLQPGPGTVATQAPLAEGVQAGPSSAGTWAPVLQAPQPGPTSVGTWAPPAQPPQPGPSNATMWTLVSQPPQPAAATGGSWPSLVQPPQPGPSTAGTWAPLAQAPQQNPATTGPWAPMPQSVRPGPSSSSSRPPVPKGVQPGPSTAAPQPPVGRGRAARLKKKPQLYNP